MNPLLVSALESLLRAALMFLSGWFIHKGIWTNADAKMYVAAAAPAILSFIWSRRAWMAARAKLLLALSVHHAMTENDLNEMIKAGAKTPALTTPPNTIPGVPK